MEITFYLAMPHGHGRSTRSLWAWTAILHWPLMVMVGLFSTQSEASEVTRREALAQAREAQWSLLRSQMSPHFLFNAISAFVELGRRDWPATEQGLLGLAEVYRQLLDLSEVMETTLGSEQKLVHRYLGVETLRLGPRLKVTWDWDTTLDGETVPPLVLLPLVENALKHGLGLKEEGGELRILLQRAGSCCVLEVANTGAWGGSPRTSNGVGLRNLRARLRLAYGDGGTLTKWGRPPASRG